MNDSEANKIIAEFMGGGFRDSFRVGKESGSMTMNRYTESLDALVPVWVKLGASKITMKIEKGMHEDSTGTFINIFNIRINEWYTGISENTIQQAAAHATAKAILELNKQAQE